MEGQINRTINQAKFYRSFKVFQLFGNFRVDNVVRTAILEHNKVDIAQIALKFVAYLEQIIKARWTRVLIKFSA